MLHKNAPVGEMHPIHNWEVADLTALAALVVTGADIGKVAKVLTPSSMYILVSDTGPNWGRLSFDDTFPNITVSVNPPANPKINDIWFQIP